MKCVIDGMHRLGISKMAKFNGARNQTVSVPVPPGFNSLFKTIELELVVKSKGPLLWGTLSWQYTHPGGGSNGKTAMTIGVNLEEGSCGYRLGDGSYLEVEIDYMNDARIV